MTERMTLELERPGFEFITDQLCGFGGYLLRGSIFKNLTSGFTDPELIRPICKSYFEPY